MRNDRVSYKAVGNTVIATIDGCACDAIEIFNRKYLEGVTSSLTLLPNRNDERFLMPNVFRAKAECSIEDKFNWETGKKVALDRLSEKYTKSLNRHLANILTTVDQSLTELNSYLEKREF